MSEIPTSFQQSYSTSVFHGFSKYVTIQDYGPRFHDAMVGGLRAKTGQLACVWPEYQRERDWLQST